MSGGPGGVLPFLRNLGESIPSAAAQNDFAGLGHHFPGNFRIRISQRRISIQLENVPGALAPGRLRECRRNKERDPSWAMPIK